MVFSPKEQKNRKKPSLVVKFRKKSYKFVRLKSREAEERALFLLEDFVELLTTTYN